MNKKILIMISIVVILIILIASILLFLKTNNHEENPPIIENTSETEKSEIIQEISDAKKIYNLQNSINFYLDDLHIAAEESRENGSSAKNEEKDLLEELSIPVTEQVYLNKAYRISPNQKNTIYFFEGNLLPKDLKNTNELKKEKIKLTMILDHENNTFTISRYGSNLKSMIQYKDKIQESIIDYEKIKTINENIDDNYYNLFYEKEVTDEEIARYYYEDYIRNALYFPQDAYESIDTEYKKIRFPNYEGYVEYLKEFKNKLEEGILTQYSVDELDGYIQYSLVDNNGNTYFVKATTSPFYYKILLDNYTIKVQGFEEEYNKLSNEKKVALNAHIFIQMLNTKDYENAYRLLADGFKDNYFKTLDDFKNYATEHLLSYNIEVSSSIEQKGSTYVYQLKLRDSNSTAANIQDMTIIMQLKEGTDFVMSFSV